MYDRAQAARKRILLATQGHGRTGRIYRDLANLLICGPDCPQKEAALKRLADSCDSAMAMLAKAGQSRGNPSREQHPPGETNG